MVKNSKISSNEISLLVVSCDAYRDLWPPFFGSLFKYWPDCQFKIYLGSNHIGFNNDKVCSLLIGADIDYSSNLIKYLNEIPTDWVIIWIEDLFLTNKVNNNYLNSILDNAIKNDVGYLKLAANTPWVYSYDNDLQIGPIPIGVKYRSGIGLALWKKKALLDLLVPGENAWEIERYGSRRSNESAHSFYAFTSNMRNNIPIKFLNSVIKGRWNLEVISFLKKEGFSNLISKRKKQSIWSYIYIKLYLFRLELFRILRIYWID